MIRPRFPSCIRSRNKDVYKRQPGSVSDNHLSWLPVTRKLMRPTYRAATGRRFFCPIWSCSEWGLHEKYVTISPCELLPHNFNLTTALPVSAECFCCTFPTVTCAGRYPAFLPCGARTFLIPVSYTHLDVYKRQAVIQCIVDVGASVIKRWKHKSQLRIPQHMSRRCSSEILFFCKVT